MLPASGLVICARAPRFTPSSSPGITYTVEFGNTPEADAMASNPAATSVVVDLDGTWERVSVIDSVSCRQQPTRLVCLRVSDP